MITRGYKVCATYFSIHSEFEFLKHFFVDLFNCQIKKFIPNIHVPSPINDSVSTVKEYYVSIPYFGAQSEKLRDELLDLYSDMNSKIVLVNNFRVGSFRNNAKACSSSPIQTGDFRILGTCTNILDLRLLESLFINKLKPVLNSDKTVVPLLIVNA